MDTDMTMSRLRPGFGPLMARSDGRNADLVFVDLVDPGFGGLPMASSLEAPLFDSLVRQLASLDPRHERNRRHDRHLATTLARLDRTNAALAEKFRDLVESRVSEGATGPEHGVLFDQAIDIVMQSAGALIEAYRAEIERLRKEIVAEDKPAAV